MFRKNRSGGKREGLAPQGSEAFAFITLRT